MPWFRSCLFLFSFFFWYILRYISYFSIHPHLNSVHYPHQTTCSLNKEIVVRPYNVILHSNKKKYITDAQSSKILCWYSDTWIHTTNSIKNFSRTGETNPWWQKWEQRLGMVSGNRLQGSQEVFLEGMKLCVSTGLWVKQLNMFVKIYWSIHSM